MKKIIVYIIVILLSGVKTSISQSMNPVDSLLNLLHKAKEDSVKAKIYSLLTEVCEINEINGYAQNVFKLTDKYANSSDKKIKNKFLGYKATAINNLAFVADAEGDVDKCISLYKDALAIRELIADTNAIGNTLYNLATLYKSTGKIDEALAMDQKALLFLTLKKNKLGMANCYFTIGEIYLTRGKVIDAIYYLEKCLKTNEEIDNKKGVASALSGLGTIQGELGDFEKEAEYLKECLKIQEQINDKFGLSFTYNNLGYIYFNKEDYASAKSCYEKSLKYAEAINEWTNVALAYHHLGNICVEQHDVKCATEYYEKSVAISEKTKNDGAKALTLINLGKINFSNGKLPQAKELFEEAYQIGLKLNYADVMRKSSEVLGSLYSSEGNYKAAYTMQLKFKELSDSLYNQDNKKASFKQQVKLEFERKEAESKIIAKAEKDKIQALANEDKRRQQIIIYAVSVGLILVFLLALFIFRSYKQKQKDNLLILKQKSEVETQKHLVEEQQKELLDSIHYAKRIQSALLANRDFLNAHIENNFVLFKPKDIVSGDFYWAAEHNHKFYLAVCDSTGHGVPGAFMSLLNMGFLNEAVKEKYIEKPGEIFNYVRERLIKSISSEGQNDGMDGILLCIDKKNNEITYAAANNEPILISKNALDGELIELQKDRMPVGKGEKLHDFVTHKINFSQNDCLYLYTDGYADQFGGAKGKKFKYKQLNDLLLAISNQPLEKQSVILNETLEDWRGNLEQVDDICIIGIRL